MKKEFRCIQDVYINNELYFKKNKIYYLNPEKGKPNQMVIESEKGDVIGNGQTNYMNYFEKL